MRAHLSFASLLALTLLVTMGGVSGAQGPRPPAARIAQANVGTAFTYQGGLADNGAAANGEYDLRFELFNNPAAGSQVGGTITLDNVPVANGLFSVLLDFGDVFDGTALYLAIAVRTGASTGAFTPLSPRQALTATPYAIHSRNSWNLEGNAGTAADTHFLGTTDETPLIVQPNGSFVGIGTTSPKQQLHVSGQNARLRLESARSDHWTTTEYVTDDRTWHTGVGGSQVDNDLRSKFYIFDATPGAARMVIDTVGRVGIGTTSPAQSLHVSGQDSRLRLQSSRSDIWTTTEYVTNAWAWHTGVGGSLVTNNLRNKYYIFDAINGAARMVFDTSGNVGIGTMAPSAPLSVVKSNAAEPFVLGVPTGLKVGTPAGTIPLALRHNGTEDSTPGLAYFETASGDLGYLGAAPGTFVVGAAAGKGMALNVNGGTTAMSVASDGRIGIGVVPQSTVRLGIRSSGAANSTSGLAVYNANGDPTLVARDDGRVYIGHFGGESSSTAHVCRSGVDSGYLIRCASAAEYVPTIDGGQGLPETADLVSIVPSVANPYGDTHGPFVVQKSAQACDAHLLGFIVNPELGADGVKLNDHYLPLAIFGYFPAKVTLDYGPIKRGDALTSSPKPGYAMKASGACKIIGYALEDANAEGRVQVFAHLSENAAPQVAALQAQVDTLQREKTLEIRALKAENAALEARLAVLERALTTNTPARPPLQR